MNNYAIEKTYEPKAVPKFELGTTISIESQSERKGVRFTGKVVAITNHLVTLKNKNGSPESFKFNDFKCGYIFVAKKGAKHGGSSM